MAVRFTRFTECTWDRFIDVGARGAPARLAPSFLLHNEMGADIAVEERITDRNRAKIVFGLPRCQPTNAMLLWYTIRRYEEYAKGTGHAGLRTHIYVNGHHLAHEPEIERTLTGGWDREDIPARFLKPGRNEIVFAGSGCLHVDPGPGENSSRSFDGGKTWHRNVFGETNDVAGEYMVRLRVKGYPTTGRVTSPVIDAGDPNDKGRIVPRLKIREVRLTAQAQTPRGTGISLEMRSGDAPSFEPTCWTPWRTTRVLRSPGRFVQWRATLKTSRTAATPLLGGVTLNFTTESDATGLEQYRVVQWDRPKLARSSYEFAYLKPHARASRLVKQYRLDEVVAPGKTEFERLSLLRAWVTRQWYGWQSDKYPHCPTWDPLDILETVHGNWGYGMCTHYAAVFTGCAAALGHTARVLINDHHCLAEAWIHDLGRWVCMDSGGDPHSDAIYELEGKALNALEIHEAIAAGRGDEVRMRRFPQNRTRRLARRSLKKFCRFGIPLRNNHLVQAAPAEVKHGEVEYHWNGYLWWTDDADPKYAEYSLQTRRRDDMYWTVGQVRIHLQATDARGRLLVVLEHTMPNFDRYLVRVNGGEWRRREWSFEWAMAQGRNELEVKAVNVFGLEGRVSAVKIGWTTRRRRRRR